MDKERDIWVFPNSETATRSTGRLVLSLRCIFLVISITFLALFTLYRPEKEVRHQFCAESTPPISRSEYLSRQRILAETLSSLSPSAIFVAEPGPTAQYFFNVSSTAWRLSERPLLLVISAAGNITVITPKFEETRSKMLAIPHAGITYISWAEETDPYASLRTTVNSTIYVDGMIRHFIPSSLSESSLKVEIAPREIIMIREHKTPTELALMRCANEITLSAIRTVHSSHLAIGMRESTAQSLVASEMTHLGLKNAGCLTLFGDNAALPHGAGTDRALGIEDFALFDCGGTLDGYASDVTRTVALPTSRIPKEHLHIWHLVHRAQTQALVAAQNGTVAKTVDAAAREFLQDEGYGMYFTHRLGHGIGLEGHESPYLNGGSDHVLSDGETFSDEPGVYIEGKVGVRLEDCFVVGESGYLTEQAKSPWKP